MEKHHCPTDPDVLNNKWREGAYDAPQTRLAQVVEAGAIRRYKPAKSLLGLYAGGH